MAKQKNRGVMPLVFFFVLCCGVLACIFASAASLSTRAGQLNTAVQLCRNGAEIFTACGSAQETETILGGVHFKLDGEPASEEDADLKLTVLEEETGGLRRAELTVTDMDGTIIYTLHASVYRPEGREVPHE